MSKSRISAMLAATLLLTGTAHRLHAQEEPMPETAASAEELKHQQEEFVRNIKQTVNHYLEELRQVDRTKLIIQSAPIAVVVSQIHPIAPGMLAVPNAPYVAAQYQRLMREWNRYQLLVFLDSAKQFLLQMVQPPGAVSLAYPLIEVAKPLVQVMGQILLPDVELSMDQVIQFLQDVEKYQTASEKTELVRQN